MGSGYSINSGSSGSKKAANSQKKKLSIKIGEKEVKEVEESCSERQHPVNVTPSTAQSAFSSTTRVAQRFFPSKTGKAFAEELGFHFDSLEAYAKAFFHKIMIPPTEKREENAYHEALTAFKNSILAMRAKLDVPAKNIKKLLPHHLSQSIKIIQLQNELPMNCTMLLDNYLRAGIIPSDFSERFSAVSNKYVQELPELAKKNKQFHHDEPHARKLKKDTELELQVMGQWQNNTNGTGDRHKQRDAFLRETTLFIAVLHDYVQKNERNPNTVYASNEEATAEEVYTFLLEALEIPLEDEEATHEQNNIKKLFKLMCYQLIPGGTTVLLGDLMANLRPGGAVASMDLIELQPVVEKVLQETGAEVPSLSHNETLIYEVQQAAKVLAKNDKTPGAAMIHAIDQVRVVDEEGKQTLATVPLLETYCHGAPMIKNFFEHYFRPYFSDEALRPYYTPADAALFGSEAAFFAAVNQQNFFTSFTPHWFMPLEFIPESRAEQVEKLQDFIALCREEYSGCKNPAAFTTFFDTAFIQHDIKAIMAQVFFSSGAIAFEGKFIDSQKGPLLRRAGELRKAGFNKALIQCLVDPTVPETDKKNLVALNSFYEGMGAALLGSDTDLIKEIMMGAIFSEGQLLAYEAKHLLAAKASSEENDEDSGVKRSYP